jgi:F0F1-type ATP synthase epsilon subunit
MVSLMAEPLRLRVMTPTVTLLDVQGVTNVRVQLADGGSIGLRPGHAPLLAETIAAPLEYSVGEAEHHFDTQAGILFVDTGTATIFTSGSGEYEIVDPGAGKFDRLANELLNRLGTRSVDGSGNDG